MAIPKRLMTEDLGKTAEYAICLLLNTPFGGTFKYPLARAERLRDRLTPALPRLTGFKHTGRTSNEYDFQNAETGGRLSVKTTKGSAWKVCPQNIGQTTKKRFCEAFSLALGDSPAIKAFIRENLPTLLNTYMERTFHCPMLFYNESSDTCLFIEIKEPISWALKPLTLSRNADWNESTTLKIDGRTIGEFQIHNHRDGVKFRFDLKNLLHVFPEHFTVTRV